jgi:sterol 3beta-glucosyltransferase
VHSKVELPDMRVFIVTVGSRGDVQPYIALAVALRDAGHEVTLGTNSTFKDFVVGHGLNFAAVGGDVMEAINSDQAKEWIESGRNPLKFAVGFRDLMVPWLHGVFEDTWRACQNAQLILGSGTALYSGGACAEKLGVPFVQAYLQPVHPTTEFPSALFPIGINRGGGLGNLLTHIVGGQTFWQLLHPTVNRVRREVLALPPISGLWGPIPDFDRRQSIALYGFSPAVIPKPKNWLPIHHVTGYWFLDEPNWQPPRELVDFLDAGAPPVCVGFGSISDKSPQRNTEAVIAALEKTKQRGILLTGWGGLTPSDLPPGILLMREAPHSWLFPRCATVVHHGGAGATAAGFRSGVPAVIIPFFGDQPFWADRAYAIGVSPRPVARHDLSADTLAAAISTALNDAVMRRRAAALGATIETEHGARQAAQIVSDYFATATSTRTR